MVQVLQVQEQVLDPEGGPLAHGGGLGRLEVGEAQAGLVLPPAGEPAPRAAITSSSRRRSSRQGLTADEQVAVVGDEAAGGPQVDDGPGPGRLLAPGVDGGHHVVAQARPRSGRWPPGPPRPGWPAAPPSWAGGDGQAQLRLAFRQGHPEPAPDPHAVQGGEQADHGLGGIAGGQGMLEAFQFTGRRWGAGWAWAHLSPPVWQIRAPAIPCGTCRRCHGHVRAGKAFMDTRRLPP